MAATSAPAAKAALLDLCEPLFQYICRLNRAGRARSGAPGGGAGDTTFLRRGGGELALDYASVRSEVKGMLEDIQRPASVDFRLSTLAKKMELPLMFFVDSMIAESRLPFAAEWNNNRLAYEHNELAGDEAFFDAVEEAQKETGDEAAERLAVFYVCIGLGFTGIHTRQPEYLRKTMLAIAPRIRHLMDADQAAKICPESYEGVDTRDLVPRPGGRLAVVGILFACFAAALLVSYIYIYRRAASDLGQAVSDIVKSGNELKAGTSR